MAKVINAISDALGASTSWVPTGDFVIQVAVDDANSGVTMQLETRLDAAAAWAAVLAFNPRSEPLVSVIKLPEVRLTWTGSKSALSAWSV